MDNILYARDFGAIADGRTNNTIAFEKAISAAISSLKPVEIALDSGEYRFNADIERSAAILIRNASNLTISGKKGETVFVIENPSIGTFLINDSMNIILRNIIIDYDPLPFTQGTVAAFNYTDSTIDIDIDNGYDFPDQKFYKIAESRAGITANLAGDETRYGLFAIWSDEVSHVKDRIYRIKALYPEHFKECEFNIGDRFFYKSSRWTQAGVCAVKSENVSIEDITIYAGPSIATMWAMCSKVHIDRLVVSIKPGTDRLLANCADGIHAFGIRNGMIVENSNFSGNGDDEINIHCRAGYVKAVLSTVKIVIDSCGTSDYREGDILQIFDIAENIPRGQAKIESIEIDHKKSNIYTIILDNTVDGIIASEDRTVSDMIYNLSACGQGSVFRNNIFGIGAGRNILLQSHDVLIEGNSFKSQDGWSICIYHDSNFPEGPQGCDITIRDNTFTGVGRAKLASINIGVSGPKKGQKPFKNIKIENNIFIDPRNTVISSNGADGLIITGNKVIIDNNIDMKEKAKIILENSANVEIEKNDHLNF